MCITSDVAALRSNRHPSPTLRCDLLPLCLLHIIFRFFLFLLFSTEILCGIHNFYNVKIAVLCFASSSWLSCLYGDPDLVDNFSQYGTYKWGNYSYIASTLNIIIVDLLWILVGIWSLALMMVKRDEKRVKRMQNLKNVRRGYGRFEVEDNDCDWI